MSTIRRPLIGSFLVTVLVQGANVGTGLILARGLGVEQRGALAAAILWPSVLVAVGVLGLSEAVTYRAARRTESLGVLVGSAAATWLVQSVLLVGLGAVVSIVALSGHDRATLIASLVYLGYIPSYLLAVYCMSVLQGLQRHRDYQVLRLATVLFAFVGLVGVAAAGHLSITAAAAVYVASYAGIAVTATATMLRAGARPSTPRADVVRGLLGYGIRSHSATITSLLNERLDLLLISVLLAPAKLGLYVVAVTLASATTMIGASVQIVAMPTIAQMTEGRERSLAAARLVRLTLAASVAIALVGVVATPVVLNAFFGAEFEGAATAARFLLLASAAFGVGTVATGILRAVGKPLEAGYAQVGALVVTAVGLGVLLPWLGITGAAVTSLAAYATATTVMLGRAARALDVPARTFVIVARRTELITATAVPARES